MAGVSEVQWFGMPECVNGFKSGNKLLAKQLIGSKGRLSHVRTSFDFEQRCTGLGTGFVRLVSLLHLAAYWGWKDVVTLLIVRYNCASNTKDENGNVPLHYAAVNGHFEVVQYLIDDGHCDPMERNFENGVTPLYIACRSGHLDIVKYFFGKFCCSPSWKDNCGDTLLHIASWHGHLSIIVYFIEELQCNPSCGGNSGSTPLHYACIQGHFNIVLYLVSKVCCNLACVDNSGNTPLHYACLRNHANIVQYLLLTKLANPLAVNKNGNTPLSYSKGKYDIIDLLQPFVYSSSDPVQRFTKLILVGDRGSAKTTMAQSIVLLASKSGSAPAVDFIADIQSFTAGIIPQRIESDVGNFVVYDFAGQQDYYFSHAAILEQVLHNSPAMFICMINLSKSNESICRSLHYWLTFIDTACKTVEGRSYIAIVGSHADLLQSRVEIEEKALLLHNLATVNVGQQKYAGYIMTDCRQADTNASHEVVSMLVKGQNVMAHQLPISSYCHILYAFLRTRMSGVGFTLKHLISAITHEKDSLLPHDPLVLIDLLTVLSNKGLILFLNHSNSSWIVVKTDSLINEINSTLFASSHFTECLVPAFELFELFPHYDPEMLLGFLELLNFYQPIDHPVLKYTNLLFFPGLIQSERPNSLIQQETLQFGWCLGCMDVSQFFHSRFLHDLLLSVAYSFSLFGQYSSSSSLTGAKCMCTIWKNGIYWTDDDNITTVIELLDNNQWLLLAMSYNEDSRVQFAEIRGSIIRLVHDLTRKHCLGVKVREFLVSPDLIQNYPFDNLLGTNLFDIYEVAHSILLRKPVILNYTLGTGYLETRSLFFEPYYFLRHSDTCQLFNPSMSYQSVPESLLHEVEKFCHPLNIKPHVVYGELKEYLDRLSVFTGRNPMVSYYIMVLSCDGVCM